MSSDFIEIQEKARPGGLKRFMMFVAIAIALSGCLLVTSILLYNHDGAAQLDLSLPGYRDVRDKATKSNQTDYDEFPSTGLIDKKAVASFRSLFNDQASKLKSVSAFSSDPLNPTTLFIIGSQ